MYFCKSCLKSNPYCVKCTQKIVTGAKLLETKIGDKLSKLTEMYDIKYKIIDNDIICKCRNCDKTYKRKYYTLSTQKHPYLCESCAKRYVCQYKLTSDYVNQKLIDINLEILRRIEELTKRVSDLESNQSVRN